MSDKILTIQYALDPTPSQTNALSSNSGAVRFAYNWGLARVFADWDAARAAKAAGLDYEYANNSAYSLRKEFTKVKDEIAPWWRENSKEAYATGFANLERALKNFYAHRGGVPRFKSKWRDDEGIYFSTGALRLSDDRKHLVLPRIGAVKLHERASKLARLLAAGGRLTGVRVRYQRTRWFASVTVRVSEQLWLDYHLTRTKKDRKPAVGVDVGIKHAAVFSDGTVIENVKAYEKELRRLRRLQRRLARQRKFNKQTGEVASNRYERTRKRIAKSSAKVTNIEIDFAHKLSKHLVDNYQLIGLEDLNVVGMVKNRRLSRRIAHADFARLRQFTTYKADWYGNDLRVIDRFFPSSKRCSDCGTTKAKLSLSERVFVCENAACGNTMDRDLNAAINIKNEAVAQSCGETLNGRGGEGSGRQCKQSVKPAPMKRQVRLAADNPSGVSNSLAV